MPGERRWKARCDEEGCPCAGLVVWVREDQELVSLACTPTVTHAVTEHVVDGAIVLRHVPAGTSREPALVGAPSMRGRLRMATVELLGAVGVTRRAHASATLLS